MAICYISSVCCLQIIGDIYMSFIAQLFMAVLQYIYLICGYIYRFFKG